MLSTHIKVSDLVTAHDCIDAVESIERDKRNYMTSWGRWSFGGICLMSGEAVRKITAINRKLKAMPDSTEDDS